MLSFPSILLSIPDAAPSPTDELRRDLLPATRDELPTLLLILGEATNNWSASILRLPLLFSPPTPT